MWAHPDEDESEETVRTESVSLFDAMFMPVEESARVCR